MCKTLALFTTNSRETEIRFIKVVKNFKISPKKEQEILPPPLFPTARTSLEDRPPRKGDFSIRLFVVELFALVGTAPSMSLLLTDISFESWPARSSLLKKHSGAKCTELSTDVFAQILSTADSNSFPRENRASIHPKDCVGATNSIFFFPPYLRAQLMTSLHPVASVLAARKMSHILGQTPPTLEPVYRRLASHSWPLFV